MYAEACWDILIIRLAYILIIRLATLVVPLCTSPKLHVSENVNSMHVPRCYLIQSCMHDVVTYNGVCAVIIVFTYAY